MDKKVSYLFLIIILILATWIFVDNISFKGQAVLEETESQQSKEGTELTLQQEVESEYTPDLVQMVLGVETTGKNVEEILEENNKKMEKVTSSLKEIEGLSLETKSFRVNSINRKPDDQKPQEYKVLNQIEVKTSNLEITGEIIQTAVNSGANQVLSLNYTLEDKEQVVKEVTEIAVEKIEEKAQNIARKLDKDEIELDSLNINDRYSIGAGKNYALARDSLESAASIPPISPEDVQVRVDLRAVYTVK